jgi:hypothetical protein
MSVLSIFAICILFALVGCGVTYILLPVLRHRPIKKAPKKALEFNDYALRIHSLLANHSPTSAPVQEALKELQDFAAKLRIEVVGPEVWGAAYLRINSHVNSDHSTAVANINRSGRILTSTEEEYLQLILTHRCGWSATSASHLNDSWVRYIQTLYNNVEGLLPILDSLVWAEDLEQYPKGLSPQEPSFFLLANRESFYVFILDELTLCHSGKTLADVYYGLKNGRFHGDKEGDWDVEDLNPRFEEWDSRHYFPLYGKCENSDIFELLYKLKEFSN